MKKRISLLVISLVLVLPISVAATSHPHDSPGVLYTVSVTLDPFEIESYSVTCYEGDVLSISFEE